MVQTVVVGVVVGAIFTIGLRWRAARINERVMRSREQFAALVVREEMKSAISALDLALKGDDSKWLVSMSESRTLSEAWHEHGEELVGLGARSWEVLSNAVNAVEPSYGLVSVSAQADELRASLMGRRELLVKGIEVLNDVHEQRTRPWSTRPDRADSLLADR
jgi:hypothetical protein